MDTKHMGVCAVLGIGALIALYYATQNDGSRATPVPRVQTEEQMMGLSAAGSIQYNPGTMLDMRPELHFWAPGFNTNLVEGQSPQPTKTAHRYPAVSGGNLTAVMHHGWTGYCPNATDNGWFNNPPEAAVI